MLFIEWLIAISEVFFVGLVLDTLLRTIERPRKRRKGNGKKKQRD